MKTQVSISLFAVLTATLLLHCLAAPTAEDTEFIRSNCQNSSYPDVCINLLSPYARRIKQNPVKLACISISISLKQSKAMANYVSTINRQADDHKGFAGAVNICYSMFTDVVDYTHDSLIKMRSLHLANSKESYSSMLDDVLTYMSDAITSEDTCLDGILEFDPDGKIILLRDIQDKTQMLEKVTEVALAMVTNFANLTVIN